MSKYRDVSFNPRRISQPKANAEMRILAEKLGGEMQGRWWVAIPGAWPSIVGGSYRGYPVKVTGLFHMMPGDRAHSVSLILSLPAETEHHLKLQNFVSVRFAFYVDLEQTDGMPTYSMDDELAEKLLPPEIHAKLVHSGLDFVLTLSHDRLVLSVYGLYEHTLHLQLLDLLADMADALVDTQAS
ncbi:MAG: hypothetical protein ACOX18_04725 [Bacillota bacterium]|jgi:hypothetical protein